MTLIAKNIMATLIKIGTPKRRNQVVLLFDQNNACIVAANGEETLTSIKTPEEIPLEMNANLWIMIRATKIEGFIRLGNPLQCLRKTKTRTSGKQFLDRNVVIIAMAIFFFTIGAVLRVYCCLKFICQIYTM